MAKKVEIELVRSLAGCQPKMRATVEALALRKLRDKRVVPDNHAIRGMVAQVPHLVKISEVKE